MPEETREAVNLALNSVFVDMYGQEHLISKETPSELVEFVRNYFNVHEVEYNSFSYDDLLPFLD